MADSIQTQVDEIQAAIDVLEAQRGVLGDKVVNTSLATLRAQLAVLKQQAAAQPSPAEDRRMVTILFTDMVGSTSMAEKLDPEEWRQIVAKTHTAIGDAVTAHHGTIAQYLGDGLLAFFGAKEVSENDPENAIRAGLEAQDAVINLLSAEQVQIRVGIHTGLVVVGELGAEAHKEFTASGDAMNLAARLQSSAPPGGILISHDTYRYVRGVFDVTPRPPLTVKGKSEPIQTYLVRRAKPRPFRSVTRGVAGIETRTVGREMEIEILRSAYLRAFEHHGMVWAQQVGDLGIGKSRLVSDMTDWLELREETYRLLRARSFPDDTKAPFALVRRLWFDRFQIAEDAPLEQAERKWVERFKELSGKEDCEEAAHALGLLVGLPFENSPYIKGMRNDPEQVKGRALVVSRELLQAVRLQSPVVVLLEDLQWTDQASWEYLVEALVYDSAEHPNGMFILGAARPEWQPPQALADLLQANLPEEKDAGKCGLLLHLAPLSEPDSRLLVREILRLAESIPEQVVDLIVERSEGVPYYIEEMVNWLIDHGILDTHLEQWQIFPEKLKEQPLPATLQHLLLTRLSSLSQAERAALQRGAIFGRRFWTGGVEALGVPGGAQTLGHLQPRGFVEAAPESAFQGDTEWSFNQSLLQEVTYESVLKRERLALHKVAAEWLEKQARQAGRLDEFAGLLGEHCERAGELSAAADWYIQAGKRAMAQGAAREAMGFYTQALELLPPVDRERRWQALSGRLDGSAILSEVGSSEADLSALLDLAHSFGDDEHLAEAYLGRASFALGTQKDTAIVDQNVQAALAAAQRCGNEAIEAKALALTAVAFAVRVDKPASIQNIEQALKIARRLDDESVLAFVLGRAGFCYGQGGDFARGYAMQREQTELNHRLGNRSQEAVGLNNMGSSLMTVGLYKQARSLFEQSLAICEALGTRVGAAFIKGNLGEIYRHTGDLRNARLLLEQALMDYSPSQDPFGRAFMLNELGWVLLAIGDIPGASRHFTESRQLTLNKEVLAAAHEATAGQSACALAQGKLDEARQNILEVWEYLKTHGLTMLENPARVYHTCFDVFEALGDGENARLVLENGYHALMEKADTINVPEWRQSFLENVPDNRALVEMWERRKM